MRLRWNANRRLVRCHVNPAPFRRLAVCTTYPVGDQPIRLSASPLGRPTPSITFGTALSLSSPLAATPERHIPRRETHSRACRSGPPTPRPVLCVLIHTRSMACVSIVRIQRFEQRGTEHPPDDTLHTRSNPMSNGFQIRAYAPHLSACREWTSLADRVSLWRAMQ